MRCKKADECVDITHSLMYPPLLLFLPLTSTSWRTSSWSIATHPHHTQPPSLEPNIPYSAPRPNFICRHTRESRDLCATSFTSFTSSHSLSSKNANNWIPQYPANPSPPPIQLPPRSRWHHERYHHRVYKWIIQFHIRLLIPSSKALLKGVYRHIRGYLPRG